MLKNPKLYSPENVERARYAQIGVLVLAVAVSGYLAVATFSGIRRVWNAQSLLGSARMESGNLSRQAATLKRDEAKQPMRHDGGVDVFALQLSRWATEQGIKVESVTPQGAPVASDITVDNASLGTWNAVKVRVEGHGDYPRVLSLLNRFRDPGMPVKLESFAFQSASAGVNDEISFDLMLTVYERKAEAS
jgi:hypothetical protein